jgi:hypothetical protein
VARSSRARHRLGLYRDGAFYVSIGWKVHVAALDLNAQKAPTPDICAGLIERSRSDPISDTPDVEPQVAIKLRGIGW